MRLFVGGVETIVPARWFFVDDNPVWAGPHGCEAQPWLKQFETNDAWGEITEPHRTWDRGDNPGYIGQCYVGQHHWFLDGMLPADILTLPPLPYPQCCRVPPVAGPIQLAGEVTALALPLPGPGAVSGVYGSGLSSGPSVGSAVGLVVGAIQLGGVVVGAGGGGGGPIQLAGEVTALAIAPGTASSSAASGPAAVVALVGGAIQLGGVVTALQVSPASASGSSGGSMGSGPTSGPTSGPGCTACGDVAALEFQWVMSGVLSGTCLDCGTYINGLIRVVYVSGCTWQSAISIIGTICGSHFQWQLQLVAGQAVLSILGPSLGVAWTASTAGWNCMTPLTLALQGASLQCLNLPSTITLTPV